MFCKLKTFSLIIHNLTCKHRKQKDTTTQRWYRINYSLIRPGFKQQLTLKRKNANGLRFSKNERSAIENHLSAPSRMHTWKWTVGKRGETHNIVCLMYFRKQVVHCFQIAQMQLLSLFPFMCVIWINWNWMKMGKLCFFAPFFIPLTIAERSWRGWRSALVCNWNQRGERRGKHFSSSIKRWNCKTN